LLAVKNVGESAIESIIAARRAGGEFQSLRDFCERIDLRLVNSRVIEALAWVGALSKFGHPVQIIEALPTILPSAQATQQQQATGQISAFDLMFTETVSEELPPRTEAPRRERLRKEKELLGLYLSDHPMGEVADQVGQYVTAYSGDFKDESLDGQRLVVGGIVTGFRTIVTKSRSTMGVATLEDLQGTLEVVVFPRLYEQTIGTWAEGAILLVAGRVDHRGEEASLLADLVVEWERAVAGGPEAFAREVAALERGPGRRRPPVAVGPGHSNANGNGYGGGNGNGHGNGNGFAAVAPSAPGTAVAVASAPQVEYVSPLRADYRAETEAHSLPPIAPAEPVATYSEPPSATVLHGDEDEEPPLPEDERRRAVDAATSPTPPTDAGPGQVLHVRFARAAAPDRLVGAMEAFKAVLRDRPGATRVVIHVPGAPGGDALPMELRRGVAYDGELLAEVRRRLGEGVVELQLA
jgi:hypothetical protein